MASKRIGFVEFTGRIEPEALAGAIARDAYDRLGALVVLTIDWLDEDGQGLTQKQKCALASNASRLFDGFERDVLDVLLADIRPKGVTVDA